MAHEDSQSNSILLRNSESWFSCTRILAELSSTSLAKLSSLSSILPYKSSNSDVHCEATGPTSLPNLSTEKPSADDSSICCSLANCPRWFEPSPSLLFPSSDPLWQGIHGKGDSDENEPYCALNAGPKFTICRDRGSRIPLLGRSTNALYSWVWTA